MKTTSHKRKADQLNSLAGGRRNLKSILPEKWVVVMSDLETGIWYTDETDLPHKRIDLPADEAKQEAFLAKYYPQYNVQIMRIVEDNGDS